MRTRLLQTPMQGPKRMTRWRLEVNDKKEGFVKLVALLRTLSSGIDAVAPDLIDSSEVATVDSTLIRLLPVRLHGCQLADSLFKKAHVRDNSNFTTCLLGICGFFVYSRRECPRVPMSLLLSLAGDERSS